MTGSFAGALVQMGLWLGVLLGAFYALAWGARRLGLAGASRGSDADTVRILSRTALDPRKSILVAHVRDRCLVLGVTPSEIRLLTELEPSAAHSAAPTGAIAGATPATRAPIGSTPGASFAARLAQALRRPVSSGSAH
jgi:flagellar biosynthetic protein FliO